MKRKKILLIVAGILFLLVLLIHIFIFPFSSGQPDKLRDEKGKPIANSISEKKFIQTDNALIGTLILGKNKYNPVLLVCGGGPGIPQYILEEQYPSALVEKFIVVYWDYRGTGLSFERNPDPEMMTTRQYLADLDAVTDYLRKRFNQDKIYILGHSFGSYMALNAVKEKPEKYLAYFAMSQVCDQRQSEYLAYDYMLETYQNLNNRKMVNEFEKYPIQSDAAKYAEYFSSGLRDKAMHELGIGTTRTMNSVISGIFLPSLRMKAYTQGERINIWKAKVQSNKFPVTEDSLNFNAFTTIPSIEIPIYFFAGKYDYTCSYELQKQYYQAIEAPEKAFYTYEESAHSPMYEEFQKTLSILESLTE